MGCQTALESLTLTGGGNTLWRGTLDEPGVVDFTSASVNGQPARMLPGNVFEANLDLPPGQNQVTIKARDGNGNEAIQNYSVNVTGGAATYTYDLNGNLKTKTEGADVWVYEWNALNQLVEVKHGTTVPNATSVATFAYDPIGRRILKETPTKTVTYTYDGADILRENVTVSGSPVTSFYVHGPGIDEPLSKETGGSVTYYHADGLGSIAKETNGSGVVVNTLRYDAWGNLESGARDGFAFTGREWDPETGLYYYRARYYDPKVGRFLSEDPIGFGGGVNFYGYVGNQPTNFSDPAGLWSPEAHGKLFGLLSRFGASASDIAAMSAASAAFDKATQAADQSYMHYMSNDTIGPATAEYLAKKFQEGRIKSAQDAAACGNRSEALKLLAEAMHMMQDSDSPMHRDENGHPKKWDPNDPFGHSPVDWYGNETTAALTRKILDRQADLLGAAYLQVFPRTK